MGRGLGGWSICGTAIRTGTALGTLSFFPLRIDTPAFAAIHGNRRTTMHIPLRAVLLSSTSSFFFACHDLLNTCMVFSNQQPTQNCREPSCWNQLVLLASCRLDRTDTILAAIWTSVVQRREPSISCILAGNHIGSQGHGSDLVVRTKSITCADHNLS